MDWFNRLSLRLKVIVSVGMACAICGVVATSVAIHFNEKEFRQGLVDSARMILGRLDVAAGYVAKQGGLDPMIETYKHKYESSDQLTEKDKTIILQQVPIYAAMQIGAKDSKKDHYRFRVFSDEPRNPDNQATAEETKIFNKFFSDPSLEDFSVEDDKSVTLYKPVRLKESYGCLTCHGNPSTSPWGNGKDILGYRMENWTDGKLHGVFAISYDLEETKEAIAAKGGTSSTNSLMFFIFIGSVLAIGLASLLVRKSINSLQKITEALSDVKDGVTAASGEVASTSSQLSESATGQAANLQETVAAIDEISSMIQRNTSAAESSTGTSEKSTQVAKEGKVTVERMINSINDISDSNKEIITEIDANNSEISKILEVISEIGEKTKVINDIVFQTKLLSFNASVEAARAGEHGKGFAVVAEEIGSLALMSGQAAHEITDMLNKSTAQVTEIVESSKSKIEGLVEKGKSKVDTGIQTANACGQALEDIMSNVGSVNDMVKNIATASSEQSIGVQEVTTAMQRLDQVTHQNSLSAQNSAKLADRLSGQAETLNQAVDSLKASINGGVVNSARGTQSVEEVRTEEVASVTPIRPTGENAPKKVSNSEAEVPSADDPRFIEL